MVGWAMRLGNMRAWHDGARHSKVFIVGSNEATGTTQGQARLGWEHRKPGMEQEWNRKRTRISLTHLTLKGDHSFGRNTGLAGDWVRTSLGLGRGRV